jgi:hypothetical protein
LGLINPVKVQKGDSLIKSAVKSAFSIDLNSAAAHIIT